MLIDTNLKASIVPIIMGGGSGSRLWPLSRAEHPKQYHTLHGPHTLFQTTVRRFQGARFEKPLVLINARHRDVTMTQMREIGVEPGKLVLEPSARNTAPALAVASLVTAGLHPDMLMLAVPADHIVREPHRLLEAIERAIPAALEGRLVTFGIEPSGPETGYGYIARGEERGTGVYEVASFVEKPQQARAEEMLSEGGHYWNAGIFLFSPRAMIEEFEQHAPEVLNVARASIPLASIDTVPLELDDTHYAGAPDISIDYAVMERSDRVVVVPTDPGWNDVGAWSALWDLADKDDGGNAVVGDAMLRDTKNSFVMSRGDRLVAVHGLDDVVVVDTEDAVLVTSRHKVQGIKDIVTSLLSSARVEASTPKKVDRPWGSYQGIALGGGYQVKHITVKPGGRLSLQYHHHRSEHWTVVSGTAEVTIGNEVKFVQPNESVYVPLGVMHRMENPGKVDLHLIEVQCGDYVGEDDIVRVEDIYGRVKLG